MHRLSALVVILACFLQAHGRAADKYTDENRPYEFGFNIERDGEKEQHRHEKKGEDGLIEGEFGFITADGVYHVTVYATDENGNFKILSMKNIRVKPYPTTADRKGKAPEVPPSGNKPIVEGPGIGQPIQSCSHCSIPTTTKAPELTDLAVVSRDDPAHNQPQYLGQPQYPEQPQYSQENYPEQPQAQYPQDPASQYPEQPLSSGERNPKQFDVPSQYPPGQDPNKPTLISAQMQIVDINTDINALAPGERPGLPSGLDKGDMQLLLYTFNYTVGFHGHYEEGYTNGYKKGYYFVSGRNGVRTRVDYEADDKGFRPKITQEVLDLISEEVPKEETEKDAKYGLKGYEFKWLYYPSESRKR